jgi:hypothetical protein
MKSRITYTWCVLLLAITFTNGQSSQKLKIFLDCNQQWLCDMDFLRKEFSTVDFVRDRALSDVHIISNIQFTGNGGESNTLKFIGQKSLAHKTDTITYFNDVTVVDDTKRRRMLKHLQLGLIPFFIANGSTDLVDITIKSDSSKTKKPLHDPWNYWQYNIYSSGYFYGDQNQASAQIYNSLSAGRETTKNKFVVELFNNINRTKFTYYDSQKDTTEIVKVVNDRQNIFSRYIVKHNEHFGYGLQTGYRRSVFDNIDAQFTLLPQIEYSIHPYSKFNDKRIVLGYSIGPKYFNYKDTTIYLKTKELLFQQSLNIITSYTKPWGNINLGAFWSNYLQDFSKNNFSLGGAITWNIFKGFKFSVGGSFDLIHDQISLPKYNASRDDLLTQRRLIATSYNYNLGIGFTYTFGSIYNSQVHPTFRGLSYSLNI